MARLAAKSRRNRPGPRVKQITIVSPTIEGAKKWARMGQWAGVSRCFTGWLPRLPAASAAGVSLVASGAPPGGKGREDIPHNGDPTSPASVMGDCGLQTIGNRYVIGNLRPGPMGFATFPVEDRPSETGPSSRSYGAKAGNG